MNTTNNNNSNNYNENNENLQEINDSNSNRRLSITENENTFINEMNQPNVIISSPTNTVIKNSYGLIPPPPLSTSANSISTPRGNKINNNVLSASTSSTSSLVSSPINKSSNAIKNTTGPPTNGYSSLSQTMDNSYTPVNVSTPISPTYSSSSTNPIIKEIIRENELAEEEDFKQIGSAILTSSTSLNNNSNFESIDLGKQSDQDDMKSLLKKNKQDKEHINHHHHKDHHQHHGHHQQLHHTHTNSNNNNNNNNGSDSISPLASSSKSILKQSNEQNGLHKSTGLNRSSALNRSNVLNRSSLLKSSTNSIARSTGLKLSQIFVNPLLYSVASENHMVLQVSSSDLPRPPHIPPGGYDIENNIQEKDEVLEMKEFGKDSNSEQFDGFPDGADEIVLEEDSEVGGEVKVIESEVQNKIMKIWNKFQGLILLVLSAFLFSIMAYIVKKLSNELSSLEIAFFRSIYGLIACILILFSLRDNPLGPKGKRLFLSLRGLSGTISLCAYFYTIKVLPLSEAVIISFTSPVMTAAIAAVVLKEKWGPIEALCAFLSLCGVTIITKPSFLFHSDHNDGSTADNGENDPSKLLYILIGVGGAFFTAVSYIAVRKVGPGVNPFTLVIYFSGIACLTTLPGSFLFQYFAWPSLSSWGWVTLMGVLGVIAQGAVNRGIQLEKAAKAAAMNYLQIIFTFIWEILFLHESIDWITLLGAGLILSCAGITAFRK